MSDVVKADVGSQFPVFLGGGSCQAAATIELSPPVFCVSLALFQVRGRDVRLNLPATGLAAHARDFHHGAAELDEDRANAVVDRERVTLNLNMPPSKAYQNDGDFFGIGDVPYSQVRSFS